MLEIVWNLVPKRIVGLVVGAVLSVGGYQVLAVDSYGGLTYDEAVQIKTVGEPERGIPPQGMYIQALSALPPGGLVKPGDREESLKNAEAAGLLTAGYALVGCGDTNRDGAVNAQDGRADMDFAREGLDAAVWETLVFVAVDVEIRCQTFARMNVALDRLAELGKPRVVYTSYNWWVVMAGNHTRVPGTVLWNAWWDDDCTDLDFLHTPYGGFLASELLGEQCQGGTFPAGCHTCNLTVVAGQNVDLNTLDLSVLGYGKELDPPAMLEYPHFDGLRWVMENEWEWEPSNQVWFGPGGLPQFGPCNGDELRWAFQLEAWVPPGHAHYQPDVGYWAESPKC